MFGKEEEILYIFQLFPTDHQAWIFPDLYNEQKEFLFEKLNKRAFGKIVEQMDSAYRADFFQELDKEDQILLLPFLNKTTREDVIHLSSYPPETAGGIMNSDDAIEFILAGASAISIGTANFIEPSISVKISDGISDYLKKNGYKTLKDIIGKVKF